MSGAEIQAWHEHPSGTALIKSCVWGEGKFSGPVGRVCPQHNHFPACKQQQDAM